jgi:hypothetical protein
MNPSRPLDESFGHCPVWSEHGPHREVPVARMAAREPIHRPADRRLPGSLEAGDEAIPFARHRDDEARAAPVIVPAPRRAAMWRIRRVLDATRLGGHRFERTRLLPWAGG